MTSTLVRCLRRGVVGVGRAKSIWRLTMSLDWYRLVPFSPYGTSPGACICFTPLCDGPTRHVFKVFYCDILVVNTWGGGQERARGCFSLRNLTTLDDWHLVRCCFLLYGARGEETRRTHHMTGSNEVPNHTLWHLTRYLFFNLFNLFKGTFPMISTILVSPQTPQPSMTST